MDSELFEQLRLLPMMPQEPRVSFKVQEHQVHTRTLVSVPAHLQRPLLQDRTVKMLQLASGACWSKSVFRWLKIQAT